MYASRLRPSVVNDGSGGVYLAWLAGSLTDPWMPQLRAVHVGPANTGKGGWPNGARTLGTTSDVLELVEALGIDAAPDGGLWIAFATTTIDPPTYLPGDVRVARYTSAGTPSPGWDAHGVSLAPFRGDLLVLTNAWRFVPGMNLVAVANDGGSGAFVVHGDPDDSAVPAYRLSRVAGDGSAAPGWTAQGMALMPWGYSPDYDAGSNASMRALADDRGGVFAGVPGFGSEATSIVAFQHYSGTGAAQAGGVATDQLGLEYASRGDDGMFVTSFYPSGPNSPFSPVAYVLAKQSDPGASFAEFHDTPVITWYGDVALAATGDGGAIFSWSQVHERFGIFAVRLGPAGQVTSVPPAATKGPPSLRLRFVPGVGVRALVSSGPAGPEQLTLHDVSGRLVASTTVENASGGDWVFPGTERLPSGLYFARAVIRGVDLRGRVAVVR